MNLIQIIRNITTAALCLSAIACTQKYQDVNATIKEAVFGFEDANKSKEEILSIPYASSNVVIGDGAEIFVVLALAEPSPLNQTQLKWVTQDYGMLVTENGRLVKTLKLPGDNLAEITPKDNNADPLAMPGAKPGQYNWEANYAWQPNFRYGFSANVSWQFVSEQDISSTAWNKETNYYQEHVLLPELDRKFTNHFWLDKETHQVVHSIQHIGPGMEKITITVLKPFNG
ncbi:YjbF family lipoprotein [Vibrio hannami]|uniref:YjbF family lipoprotein n=1 Tax=Vibrio hannami TaxID=2717094 RepID=UPI00240FB45A|nr:YjbF family lipoprotein [Vibrio hannami]MDG3088669.1 YjbF family lipoprotein [Vibrio hannami]